MMTKLLWSMKLPWEHRIPPSFKADFMSWKYDSLNKLSAGPLNTKKHRTQFRFGLKLENSLQMCVALTNRVRRISYNDIEGIVVLLHKFKAISHMKGQFRTKKTFCHPREKLLWYINDILHRRRCKYVSILSALKNNSPWSKCRSLCTTGQLFVFLKDVSLTFRKASSVQKWRNLLESRRNVF